MSEYLTQELQPKYPKWTSAVLRCAWRGALGGMIGPLLFVLFLAAKRPNDAIAIAHLPIILPTTAAAGRFDWRTNWVSTIYSEIEVCALRGRGCRCNPSGLPLDDLPLCKRQRPSRILLAQLHWLVNFYWPHNRRFTRVFSGSEKDSKGKMILLFN